MPSATASGANPSSSARGDGATRSRGQDQASPDREYTPEQQAAVRRIRRCQPTAFYDILELEETRLTVTDGEIKKAYRRLSLLTHPDKNSHPNADEAFKMVSRAFGILGDKEKRQKYDKFGTDPDSRFANAQAQNPFSAFARAAAGREARAGTGNGGQDTNGDAGGGMGENQWENDISPEEMFRRFFGGMGFGGFDTGPQFVFDLGGSPGVRVHQFGGARPRARPRADGAQQGTGNSGLNALISLLPILVFFLLPILSSLFSGSSIFGGSSPAPRIVYDHPLPPYTFGRTTSNLGVQYFVDPADVASLSPGRLAQLDRTAESNLVRHLRGECDVEAATKDRLLRDATRFIFGVDEEKMKGAQAFETPACNRLRGFGIAR